MIRYCLYKLTQWIVCTFPLCVSFGLARFLSDCQYYFSIKDRKAVQRNIESLETDSKRIKFLTREVFRNFGRYLIEFLWMRDHFDSEYMKTNVKINGYEKLTEALSKDKGVIIVTGHIGTWEIGAGALSLLGNDTSIIALEHPHPLVNAFFDEQRKSKGVNVIPASRAIRESLKELRNKKIVAIIADRDFYQRSQRIPFLTKTARIPRGPALFSVKSGAPIVPVFFMRGKKPMTFEFNICSPIYPGQFDDIENKKGKINAITQTYISIFEDVIRRDPSQWLLFRDYDE